MRAGEATIRSIPAQVPQAAQCLTVAELDLGDLPSIPPLEGPESSSPAFLVDSEGRGPAPAAPFAVASGLPPANGVDSGSHTTTTSSTGAVYGLSGTQQLPEPQWLPGAMTPATSVGTRAAGSSWAAGSTFAPISGERPIAHQLREACGQIALLNAGSEGWLGPFPQVSASVTGSAAATPRSGTNSRQDKLERVCKGILQAVNR